MLVYRVANLKYRDETLSGIGAEKVGGRWNKIGVKAVYCSENISLALLEYYVHSVNLALLPDSILLAKIHIPDAFEIVELADLPEGWNRYPYSSKTTDLFSSLAKDRDFFALKVPSALVGLEYNFILNPMYTDFGKVEILEYIALPLGARLKG